MRDSILFVVVLATGVVLVMCGCAPLDGFKQLADVESARAVQQQERAKAIMNDAAEVYLAMTTVEVPVEVTEKVKAISKTADDIGAAAVKSEAWHVAMSTAVGPPVAAIAPDTDAEVAARSDFQQRSEVAGRMREWGAVAIRAATGRPTQAPASTSSSGSGWLGLLGFLGGPAGMAGVMGYKKLRSKKDEEQDKELADIRQTLSDLKRAKAEQLKATTPI